MSEQTTINPFKVGDKVTIRPGIEHGDIGDIARIFSNIRDRQIVGTITTTDSGVPTRPIKAMFGEDGEFCFSIGEIAPAPAAPALDSQAELIALRAERDDALNALSRIVDQAFDVEYGAYTWEDFDNLRWIARRALSGITRRMTDRAAAEALEGKRE